MKARCAICYQPRPCLRHDAPKPVVAVRNVPADRQPPFSKDLFDARMQEIHGAMRDSVDGAIVSTAVSRAKRASSNFDELSDQLDLLEAKHDMDAGLDLDGLHPTGPHERIRHLGTIERDLDLTEGGNPDVDDLNNMQEDY